MKYHVALVMMGVGFGFLFTRAACADTILISNIFSGANTGSGSVSVSGALSVGSTHTATIGPGYNGTVTLGAGLFSNLSLAVNAGNDGELSFTEGGLLGAAASFSATKLFTDTGTVLAAGSAYRLTLTGASTATLSLLSTLELKITQGSTVLADTSTGLGFAGILNLASLFGGGTSQTIQFTTPASIDTSVPMTLTLSGTALTTLGSQTIDLTGGSLSMVSVPEPPVHLLFGLGSLAAGVAALRRRWQVA